MLRLARAHISIPACRRERDIGSADIESKMENTLLCARRGCGVGVARVQHTAAAAAAAARGDYMPADEARPSHTMDQETERDGEKLT